MKILRYLLAVSVALATVVLVVSFMANNENVAAFSFAQIPPPTPAPTRTPGPPAPIGPRPIPTLAQPLTEEGALRKALENDSRIAVWREPWSLDTVRSEPGRITIRWYPDRTVAGTQYALDEFESGPVWAVTIRGNVRLYGRQFEEYEGVTFIIAQKTGNFLGWRSGPLISGQSPPPLPVTLSPQIPTTPLPSGGTPRALTSSSCTQNPPGLSFSVSQQPGKAIIPEVPGPIRSFYVEGTGFIPGERVNVVIKARITGPATMASTAETVWTDSTFATSIGAALSQPKMPFDLYVIH